MTIKNSASSEGGPIESSSDPAVEEGSDDNYDNVILRLKSLSIPEHPEDANLNEHTTTGATNRCRSLRSLECVGISTVTIFLRINRL